MHKNLHIKQDLQMIPIMTQVWELQWDLVSFGSGGKWRVQTAEDQEKQIELPSVPRGDKWSSLFKITEYANFCRIWEGIINFKGKNWERLY